MLLFLFLFGLALGAVAPSGVDQEHIEALLQVNCPLLWISFNNHCYKYVSNRMTWVDAELHCVSQDANLVSIHSLEEHNFVKALIKKSDITEERTWIGLSDIHKEGTWMWSDGSKVDFVTWNQGQPDNHLANENCVHTNYYIAKKWNDALCSELYAFVCQSRTVFS
uniref:C-type lectin n=1 Tax=Trachidermus fasciatus TaxID=290630 RepID=K9MQ70_TRAFA|nr:C-type lectin [Trachidermus fasciatus]